MDVTDFLENDYNDDLTEAQKRAKKLTDGNWTGCFITDQPYVKRKVKSGGDTVKERDVDEMLSTLGKRMSKNGRLDEYRERQHYTKPSEERRQKRQEREYEMQKQKDEDPISGS